MNYQSNFGSNFPEKLIQAGTHKNVDDSVVSLVNQYNLFIHNNDNTSANALYEANKSILAKYRIDCSDINRIEEEIYNTGLCALSFQNTIITQTEPKTEQYIGGIWLKEY